MINHISNLGATLWRAMGDGALVTDGALVLGANRALATALGTTEEDLVGRPLTDLFATSLAATHDGYGPYTIGDLVRDAAAGHPGRASFELRGGRAGGREIELHLERMDPTTLVGLVQRGPEDGVLDVRLREAQRMESVGRLAAGIAHDFNNMLSPILVYSDLLLDDAQLTEVQSEQLGVVRSAAERCRVLSRRLLDLGRRRPSGQRAADLRQVVSNLEPLLQRSLSSDVRLEVELTSAETVVLADPSQIEQIVSNLVLNAHDAMPTGGEIHVQIRRRTFAAGDLDGHPDAVAGDFGVIVVSDNGVGMDPDLQQRAFEPFFSTKGDAGTGLGLATVQGIARQHGGHVRLYSEPGLGTTLRVYLPSTSASIAEPVCGQAPIESRRGRGELILVAEDDHLIRAVASTILERIGYRVMVARSGAEALELLSTSSERVDLLLTDVIMPDMTGAELAARVKARFRAVEAVYMSGYTDKVVARHGLLHPHISVLEKPFTENELAAQIGRALD
ncbi:ATP-binding protein [Engelhardtia mirabilis]|uniref:histidine kinase n=1 Tax=Engelhardtia mirabilis TaxID=2528011 RepID=A0A518BM46_9BACT|nr:Blue-light-activated protein [Planctomycetes bacterium Pla133]QDV02359.1 Blue-light-activated protein [Planctomycetes bacterium Pla86]